MERYLDTNLTAHERAEDLLSKMSLEEKMAQVVGVFSVKGREQEMAAFLRSGIGQISTLGFRMCESMEEAAGWQRELQQMVMENSPHHIRGFEHNRGNDLPEAVSRF